MSDRMTPIPFSELMEWIFHEKKKYGTIFGINNFFINKDNQILNIFNEKIETPFGPAAGPHTQLAQNIITAYLTGCRYFELKTVQTLDGEDLPVEKPCILAHDECYNVEWSTELRVQEAFEEYVKAWYILKLLSQEFSLGSPEGFVFNMSVGYDFNGIKSDKINNFIVGLQDASETEIWQECQSYTLNNLKQFKNIDEKYVLNISSKISSSITLSTLHGCPAYEIQKIASYLIEDKKLNTFVKCNPTLLGYDFARKTLDTMGYDYLSFDDHHFKEDLQYDDAVAMFRKLHLLALANKVNFGLKLTNTFPVEIKNSELPGNEMYMSGKSLYPLTLALTEKISKEFQGELKISYSGGADFFNIDKIFQAGIWPITIATTLLKTGGYKRALQIAEKLKKIDYTQKYIINNEALSILKKESLKDKNHLKSIKAIPDYKINKKVPLIDCFIAPCETGCPIHQDIPKYIQLVSQGNYIEALKVITKKNPFPFVTGTICNHPCMNKCNRIACDESVNIRDIKLQAVEKSFKDLIKEINEKKKPNKTNIKVAIIGGGTTGLSTAYFLTKAGISTTIFEKKESLGGIIKHVIPEFRISNESLNNDIELIKALGVNIKLNSHENSVKSLQKDGFKYIVFAIGSWKPGKLNLQEGTSLNVIEFLERLKKQDKTLSLGANVVIIGGGNSAMDAARAANRIKNVENVSLVYRRTKKYMPADIEELELTLSEGIEFKELLSPLKLLDNKLICEVMSLGKPDEKGRKIPISSGKYIEIIADTVISAVGEKIDTSIYSSNDIKISDDGFPLVNLITLETSLKDVYVAGDGYRGPATVVEGIADATKVAQSILEKECLLSSQSHPIGKNLKNNSIIDKKGVLSKKLTGIDECSRCLQCSTLCEICVDVCPNRANISIKVKGRDGSQIIHIDKMCNECGNCETFCPYISAPYKDKFTLFRTLDDFNNSKNSGFVIKNNNFVHVRLENNILDINLNSNNSSLPKDIENIIRTVINDYNYML